MYKAFLFFVCVFFIAGCTRSVSDSTVKEADDTLHDRSATEQITWTSTATYDFLSDWLSTNTSKSSIALSHILDGGPGKDGIPSIDNPLFVDQNDSSLQYLSDHSQGILVVIDNIKRRYPYNILNWHEIVNDVFTGPDSTHYLAVTFCPLCGSAMVFDRNVNDEVLEFGVSWKLHNSNLLMYDRQSESLWSQTLWEAVVGDALWETLPIVDAHVVTRQEVRTYHPDAVILSTNTGKRRNYSLDSPYGLYDSNDQLYFPVANLDDARLPVKEMLYAANIHDDISIAFVLAWLREQWSATITVDGWVYTASYQDALYRIIWPDGEEIPGFFEMWFSWANKHPDSSYVWLNR